MGLGAGLDSEANLAPHRDSIRLYGLECLKIQCTRPYDLI